MCGRSGRRFVPDFILNRHPIAVWKRRNSGSDRNDSENHDIGEDILWRITIVADASIITAEQPSLCGRICAVAPSPELKDRLKADLADARKKSKSPLAAAFGLAKGPRRLGFDDGVIVPPDKFPVGTPFSLIRSAASDRAPLHGTLRVIVVLVQFSDHAMAQPAARLR